MPQQPATVIRVGSDRVRVSDESVLIEAAEPMDWPVREFCQMPVYFQGRKFRVAAVREARSPFKKCYELHPWPADLHEQSTRSVLYDEACVNERDEHARTTRHVNWCHLVLLPLFPLLGLCWSGFKNRVLVRCGFEPRSITSASVMLVFCLLIVEGIFIGWLQGGLLLWWFASAALRPLDMTLAALMALDCLMRFSQLLRFDVQKHWGFCEWLWPKSWSEG